MITNQSSLATISWSLLFFFYIGFFLFLFHGLVDVRDVRPEFCSGIRKETSRGLSAQGYAMPAMHFGDTLPAGKKNLTLLSYEIL